MRWPSIQCLYKELTKDSLENAVDALWNNILQLYFRVENNYAIEAQAGPNRSTQKKAEFVIRYIHNGTPKRVILIEDKRVSDKSSDAVWLEAVEQLTEYMTVARKANPPEDDDMYGIVTVGHYSRYYTLYSDETTLSDFSSNHVDYDGEALHFKNDEYLMHRLLTELVELTSR